MIGGAQVQQQPPGFVKATAWTVWLWILKPFVWSFAFILFVYLFDFPKNELVKTIIHSLSKDVFQVFYLTIPNHTAWRGTVEST